VDSAYGEAEKDGGRGLEEGDVIKGEKGEIVTFFILPNNFY